MKHKPDLSPHSPSARYPYAVNNLCNCSSNPLCLDPLRQDGWGVIFPISTPPSQVLEMREEPRVPGSAGRCVAGTLGSVTGGSSSLSPTSNSSRASSSRSSSSSSSSSSSWIWEDRATQNKGKFYFQKRAFGVPPKPAPQFSWAFLLAAPVPSTFPDPSCPITSSTSSPKPTGREMASEICWATSCCSVMSAISSSTLSMSLRTRYTAQISGDNPLHFFFSHE